MYMPFMSVRTSSSFGARVPLSMSGFQWRCRHHRTNIITWLSNRKLSQELHYIINRGSLIRKLSCFSCKLLKEPHWTPLVRLSYANLTYSAFVCRVSYLREFFVCYVLNFYLIPKCELNATSIYPVIIGEMFVMFQYRYLVSIKPICAIKQIICEVCRISSLADNYKNMIIIVQIIVYYYVIRKRIHLLFKDRSYLL